MRTKRGGFWVVIMRSMKPKSLFVTACLLLGASAFAQTADEMDKKVREVAPPAFDRARYEKEKDAYVAEYEKAIKGIDAVRNERILAFFKAYPQDARIPELMQQRWLSMYNTGMSAKDVLADIEANGKDNSVSANAEFCSIYVQLLSGQKGFKFVKAVEDFQKSHPASPLYEKLLTTGVFQVKDKDKEEVIGMILKDFPAHRMAPMLKGQLRQMNAVGKPFELTFKDATGGQEVSVAALKGKVVMIDWWATWCGPCVEEMPRVKEIYAKYKSQGFEIIGVSLDQPEAEGGLTKLKDFVKANGMAWPQYYQGKGWDSEFSSSWGIISIPNVFLIDKKGVLRMIEVQDLEGSVKKLLAEK